MKKIISEVSDDISESLNSMVYSKDIDPEERVSKLISIDWKNVLPDPPKNNSETTKKELLELSKLTKNRTQEQLKLVMIVDKKVDDLFIPYLENANLKFPQKTTEKLYKKIFYPVFMNLKWQYNRPRPYQLAPKLGVEIDHIETDTHHTPAYPSGHTAYGAMLASFLSEIYPSHSSDFYRLANLVGLARKLQGVHYESDNSSAMVIASAIWEDVRFDFI